MKDIELGDSVKDKISGFKGTAVTRTEFLNGCIQYGVVAKVGKDNKMPEEFPFDEQQLDVVKRKTPDIEKNENGGPRRAMPKMGSYRR